MVQQICPDCDAGNPLENYFCGQCGARLGEGMLVRRPKSELTIGANRLLPAESLQQVGRAVAVTLVTIAAEAGFSWLRRRLSSLGDAPPYRSHKPSLIKSRKALPAERSVTTIFSQRVVEIWQNGRLTGQGVERRVWRSEE